MVNSVAFAPDGATIASGGHSGKVTLWSAAGEKRWESVRRAEERATVHQATQHAILQQADLQIGDRLAVEFTCPYNCGKPIRMKARHVIKNKCTECRSHLLKCSGVRSDGQKAEDDPRIHSIKITGSHTPSAGAGRR